jgi:hypothetical protein
MMLGFLLFFAKSYKLGMSSLMSCSCLSAVVWLLLLMASNADFNSPCPNSAEIYMCLEVRALFFLSNLNAEG